MRLRDFETSRTPRIRALVAVLTFLCATGGEGFALAQGGGTVSGTVTATPAKYLDETVVYLQSVPGTYSPKTVDMDQRGLRFSPHVLAITVGDTVRFLNGDTVPHNVFSPEGGYNLGVWPPGESRSHTFDKAGVFSQLCNLHQDMLAYVFVGQNPYEAVVDSSGHYTLSNVPPGTYQLAVWNSHLKAPAQRVTVTTGGTAQAEFALRR